MNIPPAIPLLAILLLATPIGAQEADARAADAAAQRTCPAGWNRFDNEFLGLHAFVPPGFFVRMRGKSTLAVERTRGAPAVAFMTPLRPRGATTARRLASNYLAFNEKQIPGYRGRVLDGDDDSRARAEFTMKLDDVALEGRFVATLGAGGSTAFVIGVAAREGELETELPMLSQIARGFGFTWPTGRWQPYRSPGSSFTLDLPAGWTVETTEGRIAKNEVDWEAFDPRAPLTRAFSITPKFCTPDLLQHPLYQMRGYRAAAFRSPEQCVRDSITWLYGDARVTSVEPNPALTKLCQRLFESIARTLGALQAGSLDVAVYDCLAETEHDGKPIKFGFACMITQLGLGTGFMGPTVQTDVWCKGWCAPKDEFLSVSPVLDRIQESMAYTTEYLMRVHQMERYRAEKMRETLAEVSRLDREMNQKHWDTQDAIAEMYADHWSDMGGYVNEKTGRIEQFEPQHEVRNSSGERVSLEETQAGVSPDEATVLRDAYSDDYMRGVYGRIEFVGW